MNLKEDIEFNKLVDSFQNLSEKDKKSIIENDLKELISIFSNLTQSNEILFNKKVLEVSKISAEENNFLEKTFIYMWSLKELLGKYIEKNELGE